jgi:hypothetical protein
MRWVFRPVLAYAFIGDSEAVASMEDAIEQAAEAQLCPIGISFYID